MLLTLYDKRNNQKMEIAPSDSSTCSKAVQSDNVLSLSFVSYECKQVEVNDYIYFCGECFWATDRYTPKQKSTVEWEYNIKFYGIESLIKRYLIVKLVNGDNETAFSYTATAYDHVTLIVQNINAGMETSDWKVGEVVASEYLDIDYEGTYCDEGLKKVAELTGVEYWIEGTTINVSRCEHSERITLGYDNGLTSLYSDKADNVKFFTRLFPIGSTRNISYDDYGYGRLQLPGGVKYIDQDIDKFGVVHHYEKEAFAHIYPRRIGEISGVRSENVKGEGDKTFTIYYFKDDSLNFNPNDYEMNGLVKMVSFQDNSSLAGRDFEVNYNDKTKEFEIITQWPYDNDIQLPNEQLSPKLLDKYILWNVKMPIEYYAIAEAEFKKSVEEFLEKQYNDVSVYKAHTDYIDIVERGLNLTIGQRVRLEHPYYFTEGYRDSRITKITRKVVRPTDMDIEVSDVLSKGALQKVDDNIADVNHYIKVATGGFPSIIKSWDNTLPTDTNIFSSRKSIITFAKLVGGNIFRGIQQLVDGLRSSDFLTGLTGRGFCIEKRADGKWSEEIDSLTVREFLEVPELRFNRVDVVSGEMWNAPAFGTIENVDTVNRIATVKLLEGELLSVNVNDICRGVFYNLEGRSKVRDITGSNMSQEDNADNAVDSNGFATMSGFATVYFTPVELLSDGKSFRYELQAGTTFHPCKAMKFVAYGNFSDKSRQASAYHTRKYTRYLDGVNTWAIDPNHNIISQFGDLDGQTIRGMTMKGHGSYQHNVYISGPTIQFSPEQLEEMKGLDSYSVSLSSYEGVVHIRQDGTVGMLTHSLQVATGGHDVTTENLNVSTTSPLLTAQVQAFKGENELRQNSTPKQGAYIVEVNAVGCEATVASGVMSVESVFDIENAYVELGVNCEGNIVFSKRYTITALEDGKDAIQVNVYSDSGNSFINGNITATLVAQVIRGSEDITDTISSNNFDWKRISENIAGDVVWNELHRGVGSAIVIGGEDIYRRALFECEVNI